MSKVTVFEYERGEVAVVIVIIIVYRGKEMLFIFNLVILFFPHCITK